MQTIITVILTIKNKIKWNNINNTDNNENNNNDDHNNNEAIIIMLVTIKIIVVIIIKIIIVEDYKDFMSNFIITQSHTKFCLSFTYIRIFTFFAFWKISNFFWVTV